MGQKLQKGNIGYIIVSMHGIQNHKKRKGENVKVLRGTDERTLYSGFLSG